MILVGERDLSGIVFSMTWQEKWNNGASILTFEYPVEACGILPNGETVVVTQGGDKLFYGFLFSGSSDGRTVRCTAYDQLRYLREQTSLKREIEPLDQFVGRILARAGGRIRVGEIESAEITLSERLFQQQSYLEMIYRSIEESKALNGYHYTLRDEFGAITLRDTVGLRLPLILGDGSLATGCRVERSIDTDSYNGVRIYRDDTTQGVRVIDAAEDAASIEHWGRLTLWERLSGETNDARSKEQARKLLEQKNRETRTISLDCMGDTRVRAGCGVLVRIAGAETDEWMTVGSAEHTFAGAKHTMKLTMLGEGA